MPFHFAYLGIWETVLILLALSLFFHFNPSTFGRPIIGKFREEIIVWLARGFDTGLLPKGPGTWGSLVGIVWVMLLVSFRSRDIYIYGTTIGVIASVLICERAEKILKEHDPSSVVLDEIIALPICFLPWVMYLLYSEGRMPAVSHFFTDKNWLGVLAIFTLFRLFDIWKPGPIGKIQKLPGGLGVTADDVLAGIATALIVTAYFLVSTNR
jgi:phosphatidylglycerophosphatase A